VADTWQRVLDALYMAGTDAGADAADWWAQDTVGGRARGDTAATARQVLAGIDDGDPLILDALPGCDLSGHDAPTGAELYADAVPDDAPGWDGLSAQARAEAIDTFRDGYHTAVQDRIAEHCRTALPDTDPDAAGAAEPDLRRRRTPAAA
jgi:hypothetical protein